MEICYFDTLASTQSYLLEQLEKNSLSAPVAVLAEEQSAGLGSRENSWSGGKGNLFVSFALPLASLPSDLPIASASIYFSFLMKKTLYDLGEEVWLKWPNDFYLGDEKVGGTITKKINSTLLCGMGINLKNTQNGYSSLQSDISPKYLFNKYLERLFEFPNWKQVFSEYKIEFELSRRFFVHIKTDENDLKRETKRSLADATLLEDGSLLLGGKRVYSLR